MAQPGGIMQNAGYTTTYNTGIQPINRLWLFSKQILIVNAGGIMIAKLAWFRCY